MQAVQRILAHEATGGVVMMLAALVAILLANSPLAAGFDALLRTDVAITVNGVGLSHDLHFWINDALMAVFFFRIGLELKHELMEGRLQRAADAVLPGVAAAGGMAVPALIYLAVVRGMGQPGLAVGWAIPSATDIAFALGVLALAGPRVPPALKAFLLTLAVLDDLGAILVIALFYGHGLQLAWLAAALLPLAGLIVLNLARVRRLGPSILLAVILWGMVAQSGIHPTIAGVAAALCIPLRDRQGGSPLHMLDHALAPYVTFFIVPVFALANAGVSLAGMGMGALAEPLSLAIVLGLVLGKQIGVLGTVWLLVRTGLARLPDGARWGQVWGIACLAGIGFTMSLFIGGLSFAEGGPMNHVRLGVLSASVVSAVLGFAVLRLGAGKATR